VSARPSALLVLAVAVAGTGGALARYGLASVVSGVVPTLLANLSGCLLLGLLVGRAPTAPWARPVLGTGLLGGWTTWSALALETDLLLVRAPLLAAAYLLLSTVGGVALAALGLRWGRR
jgi:CrcB protein